MEISPARVVQKYLIDQNVLGAADADQNTGWPSGVALLPPDGDNRVALIDTGARNDPYERLFPGGARNVHPGIQVMLRATDYNVGWDKSTAIQAKFDALGGSNPAAGVYADGHHYTLKAVHVTVPLTPLGREQDTQRSLFVINAEVELDRIS